MMRSQLTLVCLAGAALLLATTQSHAQTYYYYGAPGQAAVMTAPAGGYYASRGGYYNSPMYTMPRTYQTYGGPSFTPDWMRPGASVTNTYARSTWTPSATYYNLTPRMPSRTYWHGTYR